MSEEKIPCATCPDICENYTGLYQAFHQLKDAGIKMKKMGLRCHKTGLCFEIVLGQGVPEVKEAAR